MLFDSFLTIRDDPLALNRPHILAVASRLRHRGIGILPMETVYVLTGLADDFAVQERMRELRRSKDLPADWRPFTNLVASLKLLLQLVDPLPPELIKLLDNLLPGPITVVLPANDDVPKWMCNEQRKIWIRIPQHPLALALAREIERPLATTRAVVYPDTGSHSPSEVPVSWMEKIDFLWDGGNTPIGTHSTVIEFSDEKLLLLRSGAFPFEELQRVTENAGFAFDWTWRDKKPPKPLSVLFVCTGNICRSPMAEAILRGKWRTFAPHVPIAIQSAGIETDANRLPSPYTIAAVQEIGIDIRSHRPRSLDEVDWTRFDVVLALANNHLTVLKEKLPAGSRLTLSTVTAFPNSPDNATSEIEEPVGTEMDEYRRVRGQIETEIERILPELRVLAKAKQNQS